MPWDPDLYNRYAAQRAAPFANLLALIAVRPAMRVVDLGCGTGELTRRLADHLPDSEVLGLDNSPEMLARAQAHARPGLRFVGGSIEAFIQATDARCDLIFSHAALQWVDEHARLIPALVQRLAPGGQLAIQMPSNHTHAVHRLARAIAREAPFAAALDGYVRESPVLALDEYGELLFAAGCDDIAACDRLYPHIAASSDAIVEFTAGTLLVPYRERLPASLYEAFLARFRAGVRALLPGSPVFYSFKRTLLAARAPAA
jgi:trans-aconitate 2-methyltransferase